MKINLLICILLLSLPTAFSQSQQRDSLLKNSRYDTLRITLHFATDVYELSKEEFGKATKFLEESRLLKKKVILLTGHTDSDASEAYNEILSTKRCETVQKLIEQQEPGFNSIHVTPFGERRLLKEEKNASDKATNRRVEITLIHEVLYNTSIPSVRKKDCTDTLIALPQGTLYRINKCKLDSFPECIKITEYLTPQSAREGGFTTVDTQGEPLQSAGMLNYNICPETPIEVYIPINENCFSPNMNLYVMNSKGKWRLLKDEKLKIVTVSNRRYYTFPLSGMGVVNCDQRMPARPVRQPKVVFKAEKGIHLKEVIWSCDCPFTIQTGLPKRKSGKKIKVNRTCCPKLQVRITATDDSGQKLELPFGEIKRLKPVKSIFGCKSPERKKWFIFRVRKKNIYRKYKVRRVDFP